MNKSLTLAEAVNAASPFTGVPHTVPGILYIAKLHNFLIRAKSINKTRDKVYIDKKKFSDYLKYVKTHETISNIATKSKTTYLSIIYTANSILHIKGLKKYGKIYYTKKESEKVIEYYRQNKKRNKKGTAKK